MNHIVRLFVFGGISINDNSGAINSSFLFVCGFIVWADNCIVIVVVRLGFGKFNRVPFY